LSDVEEHTLQHVCERANIPDVDADGNPVAHTYMYYYFTQAEVDVLLPKLNTDACST